MTGSLRPTPWPKRLWAPSRIRFATSLGPDEAIARLADQSHGYAAPRNGALSKIGYRVEVTRRGFKLLKVARGFLGNPPRTIAVLDAATAETPAGTVIDGEIRLPYPHLIMFCFVTFATISTALLPAKGVFVAALVLWVGFGSLFTLAQRADAGRSVSTFISRLEAALGEPLAISASEIGSPISPRPLAKPAPLPLFQSRLQAGVFLAGISAFWGGNLILAVMERTAGGHLAHGGQMGPEEGAVVVLMVAGGLVASSSQQGLLGRMTGRTAPTFELLVRTIMPGTLSDAARKLGLSGPMVAGALYFVLVLGILTFFSAYILR